MHFFYLDIMPTTGLPTSSDTNILNIDNRILAVGITVIFLGFLITILIIVLLFLCIRYRRRTNIVHSPRALKMTLSPDEASKFYIVESGITPEDKQTKSTPIKRAHKLSIQLPVVVISKNTSGSNLQTISHQMVKDMETNPNYHQLRMEENTDTSCLSVNPPGPSLDQFPSNMSPLTNTSSKDTNEQIEVFANQYVIYQPSKGDTNTLSSDCSDESTNSASPIPPFRNQSLFSSLQVNPSASMSVLNDNTQDIVTRTQSDTQIARSKDDSSLYGPIYSELSYQASQVIKTLAVAHSNINMIRALGMGQFGQVHLAETIGLSERDLGLGEDENKSVMIEVAVKLLRKNAERSDLKAFQKEVKYMSQLRHKNVVQLLAVCSKGEEQFIVLEYMRNGDLHSFLKRYNSVNMGHETYNTTISYDVLLLISIQIADAMKYLASCNFIHRDLATRNCLVGENFTVKVADFGLSRNLYDSCYYRFHGSAMLPIRWMATECFFGRFSEKTDVWAFGVTMWEIFTLCKRSPYSNMKDEEIIQEALRGTRRPLEKPECCKTDIYEIMKKCLRKSSNERANFEGVHLDLLNLTKHH